MNREISKSTGTLLAPPPDAHDCNAVFSVISPLETDIFLKWPKKT